MVPNGNLQSIHSIYLSTSSPKCWKSRTALRCNHQTQTSGTKHARLHKCSGLLDIFWPWRGVRSTGGQMQQRTHARWTFDDPTNMKESCSRDDVGHIQTRSKNTTEYQASRKQPWETMHFARDAQTAVSEHTDGQLVHQAMSEEVPASARLQQPATRTRRRKALFVGPTSKVEALGRKADPIYGRIVNI